jgi:hypothetical protein
MPRFYLRSDKRLGVDVEDAFDREPARHNEMAGLPELADLDVEGMDFAEAYRRRYFASGGYSNQAGLEGGVRAPDLDESLTEHLRLEMARLGMPDALLKRIVDLTLIMLRQDWVAAKAAMDEDTAIPERFHGAIKEILQSAQRLA